MQPGMVSFLRYSLHHGHQRHAPTAAVQPLYCPTSPPSAATTYQQVVCRSAPYLSNNTRQLRDGGIPRFNVPTLNNVADIATPQIGITFAFSQNHYVHLGFDTTHASVCSVIYYACSTLSSFHNNLPPQSPPRISLHPPRLPHLLPRRRRAECPRRHHN